MSEGQSDEAGRAKVPALIVAGYLGSGKTTLVSHLMRQAVKDGVRLAIVSNEFGDTGIDKALLDSGEEGLVELDGGCVCCKLSDALPETLSVLFERVKPDRLVLECSGVALPGELVIQFWRPPLQDLVSEATIAVVVDAERAADAAPVDETWVEQLEAADRVVLNKADLVDAQGLAAAKARVDAVTGGREVLVCVRGEVDSAALFSGQDAPSSGQGPRPDAGEHEHDHDQHEHDRFTTTELRFEQPLPPDEIIRQVAAQDALRAKGFVQTTDGLKVLQGVGARIELTEPTRAIPEHLVGTVVVIRLERD